MKIINREACDETLFILNQDPAFISGIRAALLESGLADLLGLAPIKTRHPFDPFPVDWSALQLSVFDNGEPDKKRKRARIATSAVRFAVNMKVWCGETINFRDRKAVDLTANVYFWTAEQARQIARELLAARLISNDTVELVDEATRVNDPDWRFSIPMAKAGVHSKWMDGHVMMTVLENGKPGLMVLRSPDFPDGIVIPTSAFGDTAPDGKALTDNVISQARIARLNNLAGWATHIVE